MKTFAAAVLAVLACLVFAFVPEAQARTAGSGRVAHEPRATADFEAIELHGAIDLVVRQAERTAVQVEAEDNLLPLLETVVEGSGSSARLVVRWKRGESASPRRPVVVHVDVVRLTRVAGLGAGDIQLKDLKTPSLQLSLTATGDAALTGLQTEVLDIGITGAGDVKAAGRAARVALQISGTGDADLRNLVSDDVTVGISGAGDAAVTAAKSLAVAISGTGDVSYSGSPAQLKVATSGAGTISKR